MQVHPDVVQILHVDQLAPLLLAEVHQAAHIVVGGVEVDVGEGLLLLDDLGGVGVAGGVIDHLHRAVGLGNPILHRGGGSDQVEIELPLQPLGDDLHMEQAQETAPEAEAQGGTGLLLVGQGGVVELEFFQSVLQVGVLGAVGGVDAAEDHGFYLAVAGQGLGGGVRRQGDGVAHPGILDRLDAGGQIADLARRELGAGGQGGSAHVAHLHQGELGPGGHHLNGIAGLDGALEHPDVDDDALVAVVDAVEDQGFQGGVGVAGGGGNVGDHPLQHLVDVDALFGRDPGGVQAGQADHVLHFLGHLVGVGAGQVDLVQDGHQLQVVLQGHIGVGQGLGLHALGGVHHQNRALAGRQAPADLVGKVHVARRVDEVELVLLAVLGGVVHGHGPGLDGDAPLPLDVHVVQNLVRHGPLVHALGQLQNPVRQGGFAVVDVGDDAEVADVFSCHGFPPTITGNG